MTQILLLLIIIIIIVITLQIDIFKALHFMKYLRVENVMFLCLVISFSHWVCLSSSHKLHHESHVCISAPAGVKPDEDVLETVVISGDVTDEKEEGDDEDGRDEDDDDDDDNDVAADDDEVGDDVSGTSAYKT